MTGFILPTYTAPGQGWQIVDYKPRHVLTATADAGGVATATGPTVDPGTMWAIQRAVCSSTSTAPKPLLRLYDSSVSPANLVSGTDTGRYDEADYPAGPGLLLDQSTQLVAQWTGCNPGDVCTLRLQVAVLGQVG